MKESIRRWLGLAALPAVLLMFGLSSQAHAVAYDCDDAQSEPTGSIEITHSGNCTISQSLTAQGDITINVTGGTIDTQGLTSTEGKIVINGQGNGTFNGEIKAENNVEIEISSNGTLDAKAKITSVKGDVFLESIDKDVMTKAIDSGQAVEVLAGIQDGTSAGKIIIDGDIRANTEEIPLVPQVGTGTNVLLRAQETIKTKSVSTNGTSVAGSASCGGIQIDANLHPFNNTLFTIGDDTPNGVNGVLDTRTATGGGTDPFYRACGIAVTNGVSASQAGLKVNDFASIQTANTASLGDIVILDAQNGDLTLPTTGGTFDISSPGQGGGTIYLLARKIVAANNTVIKASSGDNTAGFLQGVFISADTIEFTGANGLTLDADGKGANATNGQSQIVVVPTGGIIPTYTNLVKSMTVTIDFPDFFNLKQQVHFDGGTSGKLNIHADGEDTLVAISGYPVKFNGGEATVQAKGGKNGSKHDIIVGYSGAKTGTESGLNIDNTGDVLFFARGEGNNAAGGDISFSVDVATLKAVDHNIIFRANGPQSKDGDGGTIQFFSSFVVLDENTRVKFDADASVNEVGSAQISREGRKAILFDAGGSEIFLGTAKNRFQFSANGGGKEGNGGAIEIKSLGKIVVTNSQKQVTASALGKGEGGDIIIDSDDQVRIRQQTPASNQAPRAIEAKGADTGKGGTIKLTKAKSNGQIRIIVDETFAVDSGQSAADSVFSGALTMNKDPDEQSDITCTKYKNSASNYPNAYWYCSVFQDRALDSLNTLKSMTSEAQDELDSFDAPVYVFKSVGAYNAFHDDNQSAEVEIPGSSSPGNVGGFAIGRDATSTTVNQRIIVVLEGQSAGPVFIAYAPEDVKFTARHEAGHILDRQWATEVMRILVSRTGGSIQDSYSDKIERDLNALSLKPSCGPGGVYEGRNDPRNGQPICPLQGDLAGKDSKEILQTIYPYTFTLRGTPGLDAEWRELWPEQIAAYSGPDGGNETAFFLLNHFPCSKIYVEALMNTGTLAPLSAYPSSCTN